MEALLPLVLGVVGLVIVLKLLKGAVKLVGLVVVVALVAVLYSGVGA